MIKRFFDLLLNNYFLFVVICLITICSCQSPFGKTRMPNHFDSLVVASFKSDSINASRIDPESNGDIDFTAFVKLYIVVADTNKNYSVIYNKMLHLQSTLKLNMDTAGRYYDKRNDLLADVGENADDPYAGKYFPRRFPSANLSIEYLDAYTSVAGKKTIALVAGIFEKKESADSLLRIIQKDEENVFDFPSLMYEGCIH